MSVVASCEYKYGVRLIQGKAVIEKKNVSNLAVYYVVFTWIHNNVYGQKKEENVKLQGTHFITC